MKKSYLNRSPEISPDAFVSETAALIGDVVVGEFSSIWFGAVLRADHGRIRIGRNSNIQDNCVVHADPGTEAKVGDNVTCGHASVIHGCVIEDNVLVGMNATILNGARIGKNSIIGAGALVPQDRVIPKGSMVLGVPGKVVRELTGEDIDLIGRASREYVELGRLYKKEKGESIPSKA